MQNLFYVPPHQPQDQHPRPLGVRSVVKRNQPTRLNLSTAHPGLAPAQATNLPHDAGQLGPAPASGQVNWLRRSLGRAFLRVGHALIPDESLHQGQPG